MNIPHVSAIALCVAALAACGKSDAPSANSEQAAAGQVAATVRAPVSFALTAPDGSPRGTVTISEDPTGMMVRIAATGLSEGLHGVHFHAVGLCQGPNFASAGGHWNPTGRKHGRDNPEGAHAGDLANLTVGADGTGTSQQLVGGATLGTGARAGLSSLADADGTALVIHARADDYKTDPSGDSGDRLACAVVSGG